MRNRYSYTPKDRPTLLRNVLNRFQKEDETINEFATNMYKNGMDEDIIIQTIICNMRCKEKPLVRMMTKNSCGFKEFLEFIENVNVDDKVEYEGNSSKIKLKVIRKIQSLMR
jgi:hypothetical protein